MEGLLMSAADYITLDQVISEIFAVSVGCGILLALLPWAIGMVVVVFKNIITY